MKNKKIISVFVSGFFAVVCVAAIFIATGVADKYSGVLRPLFGTTGRNMTEVKYDGVNQTYYTATYQTQDELKIKEKELGYNVAKEGIVVLENGNIPYEQNTAISLFSKSSVDFVFGGTGSGAATGSLSLKDALKQTGFNVNETLWDFYENGEGKSYSRGIGSVNYGDSDDYAINEVPLSTITSNQSVVSSFNNFDTGVFVLSRTGGEGNDLARGMYDYVDTDMDLNKGKHPDSETDKYKSYLEPDSIELQIMDYINDHFNDFILILNCNCVMELNFVKNYSNLSTIIQVPASGEYGLTALGDILLGNVTSSGRLVDTFVSDTFNAPSSQNLGDFEYLVDGKRMKNIMNMSSNFDGLFYMQYDEGIYVGYRYYETRYADKVMGLGNADYNSWDYEKEVIYPFGYGDSLAEFEYSDVNVTLDNNQITASAKIKNISAYKGKETIQFYVSKPYGQYEKTNEVEISAVELLGFDKTIELNPNQEQTVTLSFTLDDLKTYCEKQNGYYYVGGTYYFTFGKDAHSAINNVLKYKGYSSLIKSPSEDVAGDITLVKQLDIPFTQSWSESTNQFDFVNYKTYDANHKYLSRSDWKETYPKIAGELSNIHSIHSERTTTAPDGTVGSHEYTKNLDRNSDIYKDVVNFATKSPEIIVTDEIKWEQSSNLDAVDLRGLDINDSRYDEIVDKMSLSDAINLFSNGGYQTASIKSIAKPITFDTDGPAGFNTVSGHRSIGYNFPCSVLIGQTFNKELMHEVGELFGDEGLYNNVQGWYAPTANIHRNPFGGRNFEYFSEDPVLTGNAAREEINGAAEKGLIVYLKHFALNDQETHREKENGVCIFANEQTIRELYLKPFEIAIKNNTVTNRYYEIQRDAEKQIILIDGQPQFVEHQVELPACLGIMSSFSRLGGVWAGACYPLLNNILREEFGFNGIILTDYYHNWFMSKNQSLLGGGNCILDPQDNKMTVSSDDKVSQYMLKKAAKNTLYAAVNSSAVNNYIHGTREIDEWPYYLTLVIAIDSVLGLGALVLALNSVRIATGFKLKKKKNDIK